MASDGVPIPGTGLITGQTVLRDEAGTVQGILRYRVAHVDNHIYPAAVPEA